MKWDQVAQLLHDLFDSRTGRGLTDTQLRYLAGIALNKNSGTRRSCVRTPVRGVAV